MAGGSTPRAPRPGSVPGKLLAALAGGPTTMDQIVDRIYGDDPDGGPLDAPAAIWREMHRLRGRGYALECVTTYRLTRTPER